MPNVSTNLWFDKDVHAAVDFYVSLVPNSALGRVTTLPAESPAGPADSVTVIEFTLGGQRFTAMEAGPLDPFNHAFSISVYCETQSEIDRIWHGFLDNGGTEEQCGWLRDRWGVCWQITPRRVEASCRRANSRSSAWKNSSTRWIDFAASCVCRVAITRMPLLAAWTAVRAVS